MLRCNKEAFAKCPTRHLCGNIDEATFVEGSECDEFNRQIMGSPLTNADRIRAMSDEELGRYLAEVENRRSAAGNGAVWNGAAHAIQWLRQLVEVQNGNRKAAD